MTTLDGQAPDSLFGPGVVKIGTHLIGEFVIGQVVDSDPIWEQVPDVFGPLEVVEVSRAHQAGHSILGTFDVGERSGGSPLYDKTPVLIGGVDADTPSYLEAFRGRESDVINVGVGGATPDVLP